MIHSMVDDLPDVEIDQHILWLSAHLASTLYAIALKIVREGLRDEEWTKASKGSATEIRATQQTESTTPPTISP